MAEVMWRSLAQSAAEQLHATRVASSSFVGLSRLVFETFDQRSEVPFPYTCKLSQKEAISEAKRALAFARQAADRTNKDAQEAIAGTFGPVVQPQHGPAAYPSRWKEAVDAIHRAYLHAAECFAASGRFPQCLESCTRGVQIDLRAMGLDTRSSRTDSHKLKSAIAALALKQCINAGWACSKTPPEGPIDATAKRIQDAALHWTQVLLDSLQEDGPRQWPMQGHATSWCKRAAVLHQGALPASSMQAPCGHRAGTAASGREVPSSSGGTKCCALQSSSQCAAPASRTSSQCKASTVAGAETGPADAMNQLASGLVRKGDHGRRIARILQHHEGALACAWLIWHTRKVRALRPLRMELLAHMVLDGEWVSITSVILGKQLAADLGAAGDYDGAYRVYRCSTQMELANRVQTRQSATNGPASSAWLPYSAAELEALRSKFQQRISHSSDSKSDTTLSPQRAASPLERPGLAVHGPTRSANTAVPVGRKPDPQQSIADLMQELKSIEAAESKAIDSAASELARVMDELTPAAAPSAMEVRQKQRNAVSFRQALALQPHPQAGTLDASTYKAHRPTDLLDGETASNVATVLPPGVEDAPLERSRQADADAAVSNLAALRVQQRLIHTARTSTGEIPAARHSSPRSRRAVSSRGTERFGFNTSSFRFSRDTAAARTQHEQLKQVRHTWGGMGTAGAQKFEPSLEAMQSSPQAHVGTVGAGTLPQPAVARLRTLPRVPGAVMGQAPVRLGEESARGIDALVRQTRDHSDTQTRLDVTCAFSAGQSPLSTMRAAPRASMPRSTRPGRELSGLEADRGGSIPSAPALRLKDLVDGRRIGIAEWRAEVGRLCDAARGRQARGDLHGRPAPGRPSRLASTRISTRSVTRRVVDPVKVRHELAFQELVARRNTLGDMQ